MSQVPSSDALSRSIPHFSQASARTISNAQGERMLLPIVSERAGNGPGRVLPSAPQLDNATVDTLRRLASLLNGLQPVNTVALQHLRELCTQLHDSQGAIDAAGACGPDVGLACGFQAAATAFVERLHQALQGEQPALALQQLADVEAICLGLCAFASIRTPSPFLARQDLKDKACHALDGITASLLAIIGRKGIEHLEYGSTLTVHNWISRACKATLLTEESSCMEKVMSFSGDVFEKFSDQAVAAYCGSGITMGLNEHDIGKTAAELKVMLDYDLVSFHGREEELARVAAWLSSKAAFQVLLAAPAGVGLSNLFSLFKSLLDLSASEEANKASAGSAESALQGRPDAFALLWKQMIASMNDISPQRLFGTDGRFLASCANLLRALYESGLPKTWSVDQCLAFAGAGRRLLGILGSADPASLQTLSLQTLANLVSFIKAWYKHEQDGSWQPAPGNAATDGAVGSLHRQSALSPAILNPIKMAAKQIGTVLLPDRLAALEAPATVGGLLKGLSHLRTNGLLGAAVAGPLLNSLAQAVAAIGSWKRGDAVGVVKSLMALFKRGVFDWDELQPAFLALMGPPPQGESWHHSDVDAFMRSDIKSRQPLSLPLERYLKRSKRDAAPRVKPARDHVVGDHPLPVPQNQGDSSSPASQPVQLGRILPSMPRYAKPDADGFIVSSRVARTGSVQADAATIRALLASDREIEDEDEDESGESMAALHATTMSSSSYVSPDGNRRGKKKIRLFEAIGCASDDDMPPFPPHASDAGSAQVPKTTATAQARIIASEISAAINDNDEKKALALLAGPGGNRIAGSGDRNGESLLLIAIRGGMLTLVQAVLTHPLGKRRAAEPDKDGITPLYLAARLGNMALVETLLEIEAVVLGANHATQSGDDAVGAAIEQNQAAVLKRLMKIDAVWQRLPGRRYPNGMDVLALAVANKSADALKELLKHPELVQKVAMPLPPATRDNWDGLPDSTFARRVATAGDMGILEILLQHEAVREVEAKSDSPFNLFALALHKSRSMSAELVRMCPEMKRLAGLCLPWGYTPLMLAVFLDDIQELERLIAYPEVRAAIMVSCRKEHPTAKNGFKLNGSDYSDVLELAIKLGRVDMVGQILSVAEVGMAIDMSGDYAQKVLLLSIRYGMSDVLERLLTNHPTVARIARLTDKNGMTGLHWVAQLGRGDIAKVLFGKPWLPESEIKRQNREGKDAIALAREAGHRKMADDLAAYHAYKTQTGQKQ